MPIFIRSMVAALMVFTLLLPGVAAQEGDGQSQLLDQGRVKNDVEIVDETHPEGRIPLVLIIEPVKTEYALGETVELSLSLMNRGDISLKIKEISETTMHCLFNGVSWGSMEPSGPDSVILDPGESSRKKMRFLPNKIGKIDISCSYGMGFKGIRPSAQVSVNIK